MNYEELPDDDTAIKLMQECDTLGAASSLYWRVFRLLTNFGKPVGRILLVTIPVDGDKPFPVGALTLTDDQRLIFWPVLPRRECAVIDKPFARVPEHVTVEFPSEKVHATAYKPNGKPKHQRESWRSARIDNSGCRLLFAFDVRLSVIREQDIAVCRKFPVPPSDKSRRSATIARCVQEMVQWNFPVPVSVQSPQFVSLAFYCVSDAITEANVPQLPLPSMPSSGEFQVGIANLTFGTIKLAIVAGFPPGPLGADLQFGFPRRTCDAVQK